jgi:hypothetical protein
MRCQCRAHGHTVDPSSGPWRLPRCPPPQMFRRCVVAIFRCESVTCVGVGSWCCGAGAGFGGWHLVTFLVRTPSQHHPADPNVSMHLRIVCPCVLLSVPRSRARWSGRQVQRKTYRRCPLGRRAVLKGTCHNPHWDPWKEVSVYWWPHFWLASACLFAVTPPRHAGLEGCWLGGAAEHWC